MSENERIYTNLPLWPDFLPNVYLKLRRQEGKNPAEVLSQKEGTEFRGHFLYFIGGNRRKSAEIGGILQKCAKSRHFRSAAVSGVPGGIISSGPTRDIPMSSTRPSNRETDKFPPWATKKLAISSLGLGILGKKEDFRHFWGLTLVAKYPFPLKWWNFIVFNGGCAAAM